MEQPLGFVAQGEKWRACLLPSPRRNDFSLESPLTFYFYFIKGKIK